MQFSITLCLLIHTSKKVEILTEEMCFCRICMFCNETVEEKLEYLLAHEQSHYNDEPGQR